MKVYYLFILSALIISCGGNEVNQEVMDLDDVIGETGEEGLDSTTFDEDSTLMASTLLGEFINSQYNGYDTLRHDEFHWMDRFSYTHNEKIEFIGKEEVPYGKTNMVIPKANLFYYSFADSTTTNNAFYNWLDCFGSDCNVINLNEDVEAIKTPPMFTAIYDTTIVVVEYLCEHAENDWNSFEDSLLNKFGKDYRYLIEVDCGGPLKWKN